MLCMCKRRLVVFLCLAVVPAFAEDVVVSSPSGKAELRLSTATGSLEYTVRFQQRPVIEPSRAGLTVDGTDLGQGAAQGTAETYTVDEKYPWLGGKSEITAKANGVRVAVTHTRSGTTYTVDARAYDGGIAFRFLVPGTGTRVPDEATVFRVAAGSRVWSHDLEDFYEGTHKRRRIDALQDGTWAAPPITIQLPQNGGYAAISEGGLLRYSGMALQADGQGAFRARLAHAQPIHWIWRHDFRDKADEERVRQPASVTGPITTPWRVVVLAADLDALANADLIHDVAEAPDPTLFPQGAATPWIKPGRAVWLWSDGGERTLEGTKEFSRLAGELGFEYNVVEGHWSRWSEAQIRELVDYSRERGVGILLWLHRRRLSSHEKVVEFAELCRRTGVKGAKLDAFNHEHKEVIDLEEDALRTFAERELVLDLHGTGKNAGQERTYPNQLGHEGIRGMESSPPWAQHDVTLPFTRMIAGLGDYTPTHFGRKRGDTTAAHQVANAVILSAPLLVYSSHPASLLKHAAADMIKSIPAVWDETVVLPGSEIGEVAAFARRRRDTWFVAVTNGPVARTLTVDLGFLGNSPRFQSLLVRDGAAADEVVVERPALTARDALQLRLPSGGGFVGRFEAGPR